LKGEACSGPLKKGGRQLGKRSVKERKRGMTQLPGGRGVKSVQEELNETIVVEPRFLIGEYHSCDMPPNVVLQGVGQGGGWLRGEAALGTARQRGAGIPSSCWPRGEKLFSLNASGRAASRRRSYVRQIRASEGRVCLRGRKSTETGGLGLLTC